MGKPKFLFIANGTKNPEHYESREKYCLGNFFKAPVEVARDLGLEVYIGVNQKYAKDNACELPDVQLRNVEIYRNPFNVKEITTAYKHMMEVLKEENFKVIHCNTPIGGVLGRMCGKKCGVEKVIYTAHGFHFYRGAPLLNWLLYYPVERIMAHYTDAILTMNKEDYKRASSFKLKKGGKVYYVQGVGIDLSKFSEEGAAESQLRASLGLSADDFVLVDIGDLVKGKNHETIIRSVANCKDDKIHVLVCGVGNQMQALQELSIDLGIEKQIHFLGFWNGIEQILNISDALIFASVREGLPRVIMEAMASGLPVIASRIRGNDELIDKNGGILADCKNVNQYSAAILRLMVDAELRKKMGIYNRKKVEHFSLDVVKKEMHQIYQEILNQELETRM